ncbi:hypothetical protein BYT27DRAFT_6340550 [Phlegmacium glaucopus]|nr:hypothetical protein BYT27DRAFT_6340550 [Phlegmacium glaucopus]
MNSLGQQIFREEEILCCEVYHLIVILVYTFRIPYLYLYTFILQVSHIYLVWTSTYL